MERIINIKADDRALFHNNVDFCVGTGRMGLALQKEYYEQLKLVQEEIGFSHIRGHGLFSDDMAIYRETQRDGKTYVEYCFTYLDLVMDSYISLGIKPFLELGFMPEKLSKSSQTLFYWKAHTVPPKSYEGWKKLVVATLSHLMERYGSEEVVTWPIEVWNEPNLPGFWENADMPEYFKLFKETFYAIKELDPRFKVGGPAVCGGSDEVWIKAFLDYCKENKIPVDFITRHHYTSELPDPVGHYGYIKLMDAEEGFANLHTTRAIIDSFDEYRGLKIHITEFNTSYIPNCPIHDTNENAAFIAHQLSRLGDDNESYSYWTFGDIFEEWGVGFTPFHGGFGMVANGCIPKPTFYSFAFYKRLKEADGECVYKDENIVLLKTKEGYIGVAFNHAEERKSDELLLKLSLSNLMNGEYCLVTQTVDEETCNPLKLWHDLGEPASLSDEQKKLLKEAAKPQIRSMTITASDNEEIKISIPVKENGLILFTLNSVKRTSDRGFDYERALHIR